MPKNYWIQSALNHRKEGTLHRQLGVPANDTIPKTFLTEISNTPIGEKAHNPTTIGKRMVTVTPLLKKRAVLVKNLNEMKK